MKKLKIFFRDWEGDIVSHNEAVADVAEASKFLADWKKKGIAVFSASESVLFVPWTCFLCAAFMEIPEDAG